MSDEKLQSLVDIGFQPVGAWSLSGDTLELTLYALQNAFPALYAFIVNGEVKYVGKTRRPLGKRLYGYQKPGATQPTNQRNHGSIIAALGLGLCVDVFAFVDDQQEHVGRFRLDRAAGLEDDIIATLRPDWNGGEGQPIDFGLNPRLRAPEYGARLTWQTPVTPRGALAPPCHRPVGLPPCSACHPDCPCTSGAVDGAPARPHAFDLDDCTGCRQSHSEAARQRCPGRPRLSLSL